MAFVTYFKIEVLTKHMHVRGHDEHVDEDVWNDALYYLLPDGPWVQGRCVKSLEEVKVIITRLRNEAKIPNQDIRVQQIDITEIVI